MPKGHFRAFEVEEVHQLDSATLFQGPIVYTLGLVVQFEIHRENVDMF